MREQQKQAVIWVAVSSESQAADDKISLAEQERLCRKWCTENGYTVRGVLRVPGFSRRESDLLTAMEDFETQGITAYHDLRRMWHDKSFNTLVAYAHNRFGRSSTLHSHVIENTILSGASIYLIHGGWIDANSFRSHLAIGGYTSASEIDQLVQRRHAGLRKASERGIPAGHSVPFSHVLVRDDRGKRTGLRVNERKRRLIEDAADLLLEGVSWRDIEEALYKRGHVADSTGKRYPHMSMHRLFFSPVFWGNTAYGYRRNRKKGSGNGWNFGFWVFDPDSPLPEGVTITYNTHEPALNNVLAAKIQAEMRRRSDSIKGRATPENTGRFTGLIVCAKCGFGCSRRFGRRKPDGTRRQYYGCTSEAARRHGFTCPALGTGYMRIEAIQEVIDDMLLQPLLNGEDLAHLLQATGSPDTGVQLTRVQDDIAQHQDDIRRLIRLQVKFPEQEDFYNEEIEAGREVLRNLEARYRELEAEHLKTRIQDSQYAGARELVRVYADFWKQDDRVIHQVLHQMLAGYKLVMENGEITGISMKE